MEKDIILEDFQKIMSHSYNVFKALHQQVVGTATQVLFRCRDLSITNSTFIAAFHAIKYLFGLTHRLSFKVQGSECDIFKAFQIIGSVKQVLQNVRRNIDDTFASNYVSMTDMARLVGLEYLVVPRKCRRITT